MKLLSDPSKSTCESKTKFCRAELLFKIKLFRYKRDYYINDPSEKEKRYSYTSSTSKSPSLDAEDEVSDENFNHNLPTQHHERDFLLEKLLNSNFDTLSLTSRISRESSEPDVPKEILRQLESQMLHSDLKRESFRARNGTRNFCLNPLFEENFVVKTDDIQSISICGENSHIQQVLPSAAVSISSLDEMKSNCVENIFLDLHRVRRSGSVKSSDSDNPSFAAERCHSLKRRERKLK